MAYSFAKLGSQLGTGIGEGLVRLADNKLNQKLRQTQVDQTAHALIRGGLPREDAYAIASVDDEKVREHLIKSLQGLAYGGQEEPQQSNPMQSMAGLGEPQAAPRAQPQAIPQEQSAQAGVPKQVGAEQKAQVAQPETQANPLLQPGTKIFKIGKGAGESAALKQEHAFEHKDQAAINKEVHPYITQVQDKAKAAKENDLRLNRMEKLIENGKLNNPTFASALQTLKNGTGGSLLFGHIGIDLENLLSADSQEFNKLSQDFVKNAKDIFGSRITDSDLKSFMKTVPTLSQSDAGKRAVIKNLKLMNKADEVRNKVARQLLKEYGNNLPLDFQSEVEERAKPELDKIAEQFTENVEKKAKKKGFFGDLFPNTGLFPPEE